LDPDLLHNDGVPEHVLYVIFLDAMTKRRREDVHRGNRTTKPSTSSPQTIAPATLVRDPCAKQPELVVTNGRERASKSASDQD
jgi:hypothetical protein